VKSSNPPAIARWLLEHLGPEVNREALAGDLFEEFGQGRSKAWYWRQVLAAIRWQRQIVWFLFLIVGAWLMTAPGINQGSGNRLVLTGIVVVVFVAVYYFGYMFSLAQRLGLVVLVVLAWALLYWFNLLTPVTRYLGQLWTWVPTLLLSFVLYPPSVEYRRRMHPPYTMTYRELLWGDADKERKRLLVLLEHTLSEEADPELRRAYEYSLETLRSKSRGSPRRQDHP
jgi:hypothetical protein